MKKPGLIVLGACACVLGLAMWAGYHVTPLGPLVGVTGAVTALKGYFGSAPAQSRSQTDASGARRSGQRSRSLLP
ncbi:MAG: hypothetical protein JNM94_08295 [Phycisphaerae bacterium]|nr:hypothetical protein [Phycisphaerae bacterium]